MVFQKDLKIIFSLVLVFVYTFPEGECTVSEGEKVADWVLNWTTDGLGNEVVGIREATKYMPKGMMYRFAVDPCDSPASKCNPAMVVEAMLELEKGRVESPGLGLLPALRPKRQAIPQKHLRWTSNKIPYTMDFSVLANRSLIESAMREIEGKTCIRFVPRNFEANHIRIFAGQGCYSNVGMIGGQQPVSLGQGCMFKGTIIHELMHAIGFFHEQNRSDRDDNVAIHYENIQQGMDTQFFLLKRNEAINFTPYDCDSIMQYGETAFSKDGKSKTEIPKDLSKCKQLLETYDKNTLSPDDVIRVNKAYNCAA